MESAPVSSSRQSIIGSLARLFYRDQRLVYLSILLIVATGVSSYVVLPRMEDPLLTPRAATVITAFPGAEAEQVESLVTEKIEDKLQDVPEIKRVRSQSRAGVSFISIELRDEIYDAAPAWATIRGKIEDAIADLPSGAGRPLFDDLDIAAYAWIGALTWQQENQAAVGVLRRLARELKDDLKALSGSKKVDLFGDPLEEIVIEVDPVQAALAGLSPADIAAQVAQADVKSAAGLLRSESEETVVEFENRFDDLSRISSTTIQTSQPGQTLKLSDISKIERGIRNPPAALAIVDGQPAIVLGAMIRPDYRIDHWSDEADRVIQNFKNRLPRGVELQSIMHQNDYVSDRMRSLSINLAVGVFAVALVTFLFMGWRSSLLVTATLPLAALMVLSGLRFLGIPIHQMSVTGLIIALGLLIDNAIIATDEMSLSLRRGLSRADAVADMVSRLFAPLLASTVTTALAFGPIALMEGPAGEFVGSIAVTVMLAVFSSFLLAMTILPAIAARLHVEHVHDSPASLGVWQRTVGHGLQFNKLTLRYRAFLLYLLKRPYLGIGLGVVAPIAGFFAATMLREQFFPPADRDQLYIEVELTPQTSIAETARVAQQIDDVLSQQDRVSHTSWFLGESSPAFYYNIISRRKNNPNFASGLVTLNDNHSSTEMIRTLQLQLDRHFPAARILVRQLEQGPPFDAPVEIRVFGSDLDALQQIGEEIRGMSMNLPDVLHSRTELSEYRPAVNVSVDGAVAEWSNISEADVADQLYSRLEGISAGSVLEGVEQVPVRVRIAGDNRRYVQDILDASIAMHASADSEELWIPASAIAQVEVRPQRAVITRYNGRRVNNIQNFITAGTLPSKTLAELTSTMDQSQIAQRLPAGFSMELGGEASERDQAVGRLMANVTILAVGIVAALVLALGSFRQALLIGIIAFLSIGLGLGALWLFDYPFGFMAIVGTMGLVGVAINDSIVVLATLTSSKKVAEGDIESTADLVIEVTRHVLATTATTVVGFLPLLISGGGFWPPLAVSIGAGVAGATLISLTLVPCAVVLFRMSSIPSMEPELKSKIN